MVQRRRGCFQNSRSTKSVPPLYYCSKWLTALERLLSMASLCSKGSEVDSIIPMNIPWFSLAGIDVLVNWHVRTGCLEFCQQHKLRCNMWRPRESSKWHEHSWKLVWRGCCQRDIGFQWLVTGILIRPRSTHPLTPHIPFNLSEASLYRHFPAAFISQKPLVA